MLLPLMFALLVSAATPAPAPAPGEAWRLIRAAQRAVETGTETEFERRWRGVITRTPSDRRAMLAMGALAQQLYRYELADSLYERIAQEAPRPSDFRAAAHLSMALWRAIGSNTAYADSLFVQARAEALAAGDRHIAFEAVINLAKLRSRRAGPQAGLELVREARTIADHRIADESAKLLCTEGMLMEQAGDMTGRTRLMRGVGVARRAGAWRELGACNVALATILDRSQYFDEAAETAAEAIRMFEKIHFSYGVAAAAQWLGYARLTRGDFVGAERGLKLAIRNAEPARYTQAEAWARTGLSDLYLALGDAGAARVQAERAAVLHAAYGDLWGLAVDLQFQGAAAEARGALDDACAKYAEALAAYGRAGLSLNAVGVLRQLALAQMRAGRLDGARQSLDEATRLARASGNAGWNAELPVHRARLAMLRGELRNADSLLAVARPHYKWRDADTTELQTLPFAVLEAQLALRMHHVATADSAVAFISHEIARRRRGIASRDLRAGLAQLRSDWGGLSDAYPELVAGLAANGRLPSAFRFVEHIRARELADATLRSIGQMRDSSEALANFRRLSSNARVFTLEDLRRDLPRDAAFVAFTLGVSGAPTSAILVTRDTAVALTLPPRSVLAPLIERYLRVAGTGTEPIALGRQLGAALLDPVVRTLPPGITRLEISPDGDLHRVPFDALRLADDGYAVQRFSISLAPSATVARMLRGLSTAPRATRLLAVGDARFGRSRATGSAIADTTRFGGIRLVRLPHSGQEVRRIARYGTQSMVLMRSAASEAALRRIDWPTIGVAHFATHALIDGEGQARTALAVTPDGDDDGFLTTAEIASLRLHGALVVLSACESLGGQILGAEGLRGLTAPLFEAGARAIVVTHWSIGDRSVLPFVDRFYAGMASGATVGDALRLAKLAAIRDGASIADWAAFTVIGDASMRPSLLPRRFSPLEWLHGLVQPARDTSGARDD